MILLDPGHVRNSSVCQSLLPSPSLLSPCAHTEASRSTMPTLLAESRAYRWARHGLPASLAQLIRRGSMPVIRVTLNAWSGIVRYNADLHHAVLPPSRLTPPRFIATPDGETRHKVLTSKSPIPSAPTSSSHQPTFLAFFTSQIIGLRIATCLKCTSPAPTCPA